MKTVAVSLSLVAGVVQAKDIEKKYTMHHGHGALDERISLNLSPVMKQHQLQKMCGHLACGARYHCTNQLG